MSKKKAVELCFAVQASEFTARVYLESLSRLCRQQLAVALLLRPGPWVAWHRTGQGSCWNVSFRQTNSIID